MTMLKRNKDLIFGKMNENNNLPIIRKFFGITNLEMDKNEYATIDFKNDDTLIELKSRRITHNKYDTCFIGYNKYKYFKKNNDKKSYIVYQYDDGLFYIQYDRDLFKKFDRKYQNIWRDNVCEQSKVVLIPTKYLIKIEI